MVNLLLAKGANINAFDKKDRRALHWAAYMGKAQVVVPCSNFLLTSCQHVLQWTRHRPVHGRWEMYSPCSGRRLADLNTQCPLSCGFWSFNDLKTNSVKRTLTHLMKGNVYCMHFLTRSGAVIKNILKMIFFFFVKLWEQCETSVKGPVH